MLPDPRFLPGLEQPKGFSLSNSNHFGRTVAIGLKPKNCFKHDRQRHREFKMKFQIFFFEAQDLFNNCTAVFGRCNYPVKSPFFDISTPRYGRKLLINALRCAVLQFISDKLSSRNIRCRQRHNLDSKVFLQPSYSVES